MLPGFFMLPGKKREKTRTYTSTLNFFRIVRNLLRDTDRLELILVSIDRKFNAFSIETTPTTIQCCNFKTDQNRSSLIHLCT